MKKRVITFVTIFGWLRILSSQFHVSF